MGVVYNQGAAILYNVRLVYMECRNLPSLRDFSHVGFLCTFCNITVAGAAAWDGIVRSSQLSSLLAGQAVQYIMAGTQAVRPAQ